jgi:mannose-6-phosphate isomerase-like protein (cupin superfamily)
MADTKQGFVDDIETLTEDNDAFRHVLYTGEHLQLVLMALPAGGEIGLEVHDENDQFFRVEEGEGEVEIDGAVHPIRAGSGVVVPAGAEHNVRNTGTDMLRLYSLYGPPHHEDGVVHESKDEADEDDEEFDGETTED